MGTLDERRARNLRNEVLELAASRMRRRLEAAVADDSSVRELLDRSKVELHEVDADINDPRFALALAERLHELVSG